MSKATPPDQQGPYSIVGAELERGVPPQELADLGYQVHPHLQHLLEEDDRSEATDISEEIVPAPMPDELKALARAARERGHRRNSADNATLGHQAYLHSKRLSD